MIISVKYYGHLKDKLVVHEESYNLFSRGKPHLLSKIFNEISKSRGKVFSETVYLADGRFSPHITVLLDDKVVLNDQITVEKDCSISIIPLIGGG